VNESDLIGAWYCPGFSSDPYWRIFVNHRRWLRQEVVIANFEDPNKNEVLRYWARLSATENDKLWDLIEKIEFQNFQRKYSNQTLYTTGRESFRIAVRLGTYPKEVEVNDPQWAAAENVDVQKFLTLWTSLFSFAPHGHVPIEQGRPRPWWRFW